MKKILAHPVFQMIVVIALLLVIRYLSKQLAEPVNDFFHENIFLAFDDQSAFYKLFMVIFSLLIFLFLPGYSFKDFGFRKPEKVNYFKVVWLTFVLVLGGMIVFGFLYMGILKEIFGNGSQSYGGYDDSGKSISSVILGIWIWSSITEEIYMRGLFQSLLDNLKKFRFLRLSLAVWLSGLAFGLLHFSIYDGENLFFTLFIVSQTIVLGLLAAQYREKTKSIYIPILIHVLANIFGSIPLLFQ